MKNLRTTASRLGLASIIMTTVLAAGLVSGMPQAANADDWHDRDWHNGHDHDWDVHQMRAHEWAMHHNDPIWVRAHPGWGQPVIVNRPVVVEQPPVVFAPPTVVEAPPEPVGLNLIIPLHFN